MWQSLMEVAMEAHGPDADATTDAAESDTLLADDESVRNAPTHRGECLAPLVTVRHSPSTAATSAAAFASSSAGSIAI